MALIRSIVVLSHTPSTIPMQKAFFKVARSTSATRNLLQILQFATTADQREAARFGSRLPTDPASHLDQKQV